MTRARKICSHPGCVNLQPCPTPGHAKEPWAGSTRRRRLPGDWNRRRRSVLARDPVCRICQNALSVEVDHIIPHRGNPDLFWDEINNWGSLCGPCHKAKTGAGL